MQKCIVCLIEMIHQGLQVWLAHKSVRAQINLQGDRRIWVWLENTGGVKRYSANGEISEATEETDRLWSFL